MSALTVTDLLHEGRYEAAVARMQDLCRVRDPEVPVDADAVREAYEASRRHLRSVVPPEPCRITVTYVRSS
jgi:hypothetical protein